MITLIAKILAIGAVILGFRISVKHWDGEQLVTLIVNGILLSLICMVPIALIVMLIQGIFSVIGGIAIIGGIASLIYFIYHKIKK